jgi:hypothetical protein
MTLMWVITAGFIISIGLAGGIFAYYLNTALSTEDAVKIDKYREPDFKEK